MPTSQIYKLAESYISYVPLARRKYKTIKSIVSANVATLNTNLIAW
jgi:uncharacterized membrane protein YukC